MIPYVGPEVSRLQKLKMHAEEKQERYARKAKTWGTIAGVGLGWGAISYAVGINWLVEPGSHYVDVPNTFIDKTAVTLWGLGFFAFYGGAVSLFPWYFNARSEKQEKAHVDDFSKLIKAAQEGVLQEHA